MGKQNYFTRLVPYFTTCKFCNSMIWSTVCYKISREVWNSPLSLHCYCFGWSIQQLQEVREVGFRSLKKKSIFFKAFNIKVHFSGALLTNYCVIWSKSFFNGIHWIDKLYFVILTEFWKSVYLICTDFCAVLSVNLYGDNSHVLHSDTCHPVTLKIYQDDPLISGLVGSMIYADL